MTTGPARTDRLRAALIRNLDHAEENARRARAAVRHAGVARLGPGTAASKLGISVDIVRARYALLPYHFHYAQEEAFVVLEGSGTLRVAG